MMTREAVLDELLNRLKASQGAAVHVGQGELCDWPAESVAALKSARLLVRARLAASVVCPGCENHCLKPVEIFPAEHKRPASAHIYCDEPEDFGRIPLELADLEQWRMRGDESPASVAQALGVPLPAAANSAQSSRQASRDAEIRAKYKELAQLGRRNYVKEIQRAVPGAGSLSARRIRDIAKGR